MPFRRPYFLGYIESMVKGRYQGWIAAAPLKFTVAVTNLLKSHGTGCNLGFF